MWLPKYSGSTEQWLHLIKYSHWLVNYFPYGSFIFAHRATHSLNFCRWSRNWLKLESPVGEGDLRANQQKLGCEKFRGNVLWEKHGGRQWYHLLLKILVAWLSLYSVVFSILWVIFLRLICILYMVLLAYSVIAALYFVHNMSPLTY